MHKRSRSPVAEGTEELVDVQEAARRLSVGQATLYRMIRDGRLPSFRIGRLRRIRVADIRAYLDGLEPEVIVSSIVLAIAMAA